MSICEVEYEAHLITIGSEEEQRFIEEFLNSSKVARNPWIGLEYNGNAYQWADDTPLRYTHWAEGSPTNDPNQCVQIEVSSGYWSDYACINKNILICEKVKLWSPIEMQMKVMKLMNNPVPVGFTYAQLPKEKPPTEIWPWMEWTDVSQDYEGVFFRVVGGESSSFGEVQEGNSPRLTRVDRVRTSTYGAVEISANGEASAAFDADDSSFSDRGMTFTVSGGETRPRNMAIRIWKRTL